MGETPRLSLPLVMPAQAQKHVTVNEALLRLDALSQLVLRSRSTVSPPADPQEGECYAVPADAVGDWTGRGGELAVFAGGGWDFVAPRDGWRAWIEDEGVVAVRLVDWIAGAVATSPGGAGIVQRTHGFDLQIASGAQTIAAEAIPEGAVVYGVTGRVADAIGGDADSFRLGVQGAEDRYGSGIGVGAGAWLRGLTGSPQAYWTPTDLLVSAENGSFDGTGLLRLAVHYVQLTLPA